MNKFICIKRALVTIFIPRESITQIIMDNSEGLISIFSLNKELPFLVDFYSNFDSVSYEDLFSRFLSSKDEHEELLLDEDNGGSFLIY